MAHAPRASAAALAAALSSLEMLAAAPPDAAGRAALAAALARIAARPAAAAGEASAEGGGGGGGDGEPPGADVEGLPLLPAASASHLASFSQLYRTILLVFVPSLVLLLVAHALFGGGSGAFGAAVELPIGAGAAATSTAAGAAAAAAAPAAALTRIQRQLPPLRADTIGGLLVAFHNPRAVLEVIREFRAAYPEGDLVVLCDQGCYNFSAACEHFKCEFDARPLRLTTKTDPGWYLRPPNSNVYMHALARALPLIRSKFYMYLESDVSIKGRVPVERLRYTLNGIVDPHRGWMVGAEPFFAATLNGATFDLAKFPKSPRPDMIPGQWLPYGGQGGSILRTQLMRAMAQQPLEQRTADVRVLGGCSTTTGADYWHTAVVYRYNGTVGPYEGHALVGERSLEALQADPAVLVIHADKSHYGSDLSEEDQRILGPGWATELQVAPEDEVPVPEEWSCCCALKDFAFRPGASGLKADEEARGHAWDMEDIRGAGYYKVEAR